MRNFVNPSAWLLVTMVAIGGGLMMTVPADALDRGVTPWERGEQQRDGRLRESDIEIRAAQWAQRELGRWLRRDGEIKRESGARVMRDMDLFKQDDEGYVFVRVKISNITPILEFCVSWWTFVSHINDGYFINRRLLRDIKYNFFFFVVREQVITVYENNHKLTLCHQQHL